MFSFLGNWAELLPIWFFWAAPLFVIVLFSLLGRIFNKKKIFLFCISAFVFLDLFFALSNSMLNLHDWLQLAVFDLFFVLFFFPLLNGKKRKNKVQIVSTQEISSPIAPVPQKICVYENSDQKGLDLATENKEDEIRLTHVYGVLEKLKKSNLSAGDRLEVDVIDNMVNILGKKGNLLPEEKQSLNDYLATLLKMMAKYSI